MMKVKDIVLTPETNIPTEHVTEQTKRSMKSCKRKMLCKSGEGVCGNSEQEQGFVVTY